MQKHSELVPSASPLPPALVCFQICCDGTLPCNCTTYNRNVQSARNGKHCRELYNFTFSVARNLDDYITFYVIIVSNNELYKKVANAIEVNLILTGFLL